MLLGIRPPRFPGGSPLDQALSVVTHRFVPAPTLMSPGKQPPRYNKRLSGELLSAFSHACAQGDLAVARRLLGVVESIVTRPVESPKARRHEQEALVAAHARLWRLRQLNGTSDGLQDKKR